MRIENMDQITILQSTGALCLTKTFYGNGTCRSYDKAKHFYHEERTISNIIELSALLNNLEYSSNRCVIRGLVKAEYKQTKLVNRRMHGEGSSIECSQSGHNWIIFDFDSLLSDIFADIECFVRLLPYQFHNSTYHYQYSSSYMMKKDYVSCHISFWLKSKHTDSSIAEWGKEYCQNLRDDVGVMLFDTSVFSTNHLIYTSKPRFVNMRDPVKCDRSGLVIKCSDDVDFDFPTSKTNSSQSLAPEFSPKTSSPEVMFLLKTIAANGIPDYTDWCRISWATIKCLGLTDGLPLLMKYLPEQQKGEYNELLTNYDQDKSCGIGTLIYIAGQYDKSINTKLRTLRKWGHRRTTNHIYAPAT